MNNFENRKSFSLKKRKKPIRNYKIINDFDNINEKQCIKLDKENESTYNKLLAKSKQAQYTIQNTGLSMNLEVPIPPRPNNRDRFMLWKKRNVQKPVIKQTEAVLFLNDNGYKLNIHYEAYQAIDLYNEIRKKKGITNNYVDNTKNFDNLYTKKDKNIFRKKSMRGLESVSLNNNFDSLNQISNQTVNHPNRQQRFNDEQLSNYINHPNRSQKFNGDFNSNNNSIINNVDSADNSTYNEDYSNLEYLLENNQLNMDLNIFDNQMQEHQRQEQIRILNEPSTQEYNVLPSAPPQDTLNYEIDSEYKDLCKNPKNNYEIKVVNKDEKRNSLYPCL